MSRSKGFAKGSVFDRRHRPPPDYFSRRIQWKILGLVFLVLTVVALMFEARNPDNWRWMWQLSGHAGDEQPSADADAVGRQDSPRSVDQVSEDGATREPIVRGPVGHLTVEQLRSDSVTESLAVARQDGWSYVLDALPAPMRRQVFDGLWRQRQQLPGDDTSDGQPWESVVDRMEGLWGEYHASGLVSVAQDSLYLSDEQKRHCLEVLEALRNAWQQDIESLRALAAPAGLTPAQTRRLEMLQQVLDRAAFAAIEDGQVLRSTETEAWLRGWEILAGQSPQALEGAEGPVSALQLSEQAAAYRGRLVSIRGVARLGYRTPARDNRCGIDQYYVLWVRGADRSDSPLVVYCRELPAGFPELALRSDQLEGTRLDEHVELTGIFFKRWLYVSRGGLNSAPLVLARVTGWNPEVARAPQGRRPGCGGAGLSWPSWSLPFWAYWWPGPCIGPAVGRWRSQRPCGRTPGHCPCLTNSRFRRESRTDCGSWLAGRTSPAVDRAAIMRATSRRSGNVSRNDS
jgi:hypothetical protein